MCVLNDEAFVLKEPLMEETIDTNGYEFTLKDGTLTIFSHSLMRTMECDPMITYQLLTLLVAHKDAIEDAVVRQQNHQAPPSLQDRLSRLFGA